MSNIKTAHGGVNAQYTTDEEPRSYVRDCITYYLLCKYCLFKLNSNLVYIILTASKQLDLEGVIKKSMAPQELIELTLVAKDMYRKSWVKPRPRFLFDFLTHSWQSIYIIFS